MLDYKRQVSIKQSLHWQTGEGILESTIILHCQQNIRKQGYSNERGEDIELISSSLILTTWKNFHSFQNYFSFTVGLLLIYTKPNECHVNVRNI